MTGGSIGTGTVPASISNEPSSAGFDVDGTPDLADFDRRRSDDGCPLRVSGHCLDVARTLRSGEETIVTVGDGPDQSPGFHQPAAQPLAKASTGVTESAARVQAARFASSGLAAAAELPAPEPDLASAFEESEMPSVLVEAAGPAGADPWVAGRTGLPKAPVDILGDGSSIGLMDAGGLPKEAVAVIEAIRTHWASRLEARRVALMADVVPPVVGTHGGTADLRNPPVLAGLDSLELAYHRRAATAPDLADLDSIDVSEAVFANADVVILELRPVVSAHVEALSAERALEDDDRHEAQFAADFDPALLAAEVPHDDALSSMVVTYDAAEPAWHAPGMLTASLPMPSDPYATPSILAMLDIAEGTHFEDATTEISVPGLGRDVSQPIDAIAVARASERDAPADGADWGDNTQLALLGRGVHDNRPVDIGGGVGGIGSMVAAATPEEDGAYSRDIVILPAAQSLLGEELAGRDVPAMATMPGDVRTLRGAVALALETNPEIGQAASNRAAIEFELAQGRGSYLPSIDLEARAGAQVTDNVTTRASGDDDRVFAPVEGRLTVTQLLFDGFATDAEVERQASRVDGASFRVLERSEFIALNVIRAHQDVNRLVQILALAQQNLAFHRGIASDITRGAQAGALSVADRQQVEERIIAAEAFVSETREELEAARITFNRLVGQFPGSTQFAPSVAAQLPPSLNHAIGAARANNPIIKIADAAISTAYAETKAAESAYLPTVNLELTGRVGEDLDGVHGRDAELRAMVVLNWNLYQGGVKPARVQERIRRLDQERQRLHVAQREAEETMRISWDRWEKQKERLGLLERQLDQSTQLLGSYREQYGIGQRSLLDVLDTQNTRFGTEVAVVTTRHAVRFAEYRILASAGTLLTSLGIEPPATAEAYARADAAVPAVPGPESFARSIPPRP
jgi:outer membrane protein, adhesin transport system